MEPDYGKDFPPDDIRKAVETRPERWRRNFADLARAFWWRIGTGFWLAVTIFVADVAARLVTK